MTEPLNLEEYFADERRNLPVRRKELKQILAHLIDRGTFAGALNALEKDIATAIRNEVRTELGAFMIELQKQPEETSRIITIDD